MTVAGMAFMAISWALIIGLNVFCFTQMRAESRADELDSDG